MDLLTNNYTKINGDGIDIRRGIRHKYSQTLTQQATTFPKANCESVEIYTVFFFNLETLNSVLGGQG